MNDGLTRLALPAMREDRGRFAALRNRRVLVYWPHGLGDWVTFGNVVPLLEPSNAYAITRFGDDYVSLAEESAALAPLFSGSLPPGDGAANLGLELRRCNGQRLELAVPSPLAGNVVRFGPDALLWTDYPETEGRRAYPFHTKARNLARLLVPKPRLRTLDLSLPLANAIEFAPNPETLRLVEQRLAQFAEPEMRVGVISRTGVTAARKNWGDGSEAREFVAAMRRASDRWCFVSMDDEDLGEGVAGFRALFNDLGEPFARVYKALLMRVDLFVGIPAGPLHFTIARGGIPTIGLWLSHHPDWYDEPNRSAMHLVGRYVRDRRFHKRPATRTKPPSLRHRIVYLDTLTIGAEPVIEAARTLTG